MLYYEHSSNLLKITWIYQSRKDLTHRSLWHHIIQTDPCKNVSHLKIFNQHMMLNRFMHQIDLSKESADSNVSDANQMQFPYTQTYCISNHFDITTIQTDSYYSICIWRDLCRTLIYLNICEFKCFYTSIQTDLYKNISH